MRLTHPCHEPPHACRCSVATITRDCPIDCLQLVLSLITLHTLARAYDAPFDPPRTVGDVAELYSHNRLPDIWGLGPRRIGEIEASLVFLGLVTTTSR